MTFLLVILTISVILVIELVRKSRKNESLASADLVTEHPTSFEVIDRYYHAGHSWAMVSGSRQVIVGIDDFSARMIGTVECVDLPASGQAVRQGEPFAVLHHGLRKLAQVAPISGTVAEVNKKIKHNPGLLNESPLESGWIAKIVPTNLEIDLRNLLKGFAADGWREKVREQLIRLTAPKIGVVLQDGGQLVSNLGDHLSDDEWNRLVQQFFPIISSSQVKKDQ